jgi:hypothetical protein
MNDATMPRGGYTIEKDLPKPVIELREGELDRVVEESERALLTDRNADPFFQRGGQLVHLIRSPEPSTAGGINRKTGALVIATVYRDYLRLRLAQMAQFERFDARKKRTVPKDPPFDVAAALLSACGQWRFPVLTATIEAPTLRRDGTILSRSGYDATTGLYLDPAGLVFPPIVEKPSKDDARAALALLADVIKDFPFESEVARSVALAAILTANVRRSLRSAPMFAINAPAPGSGKSLLADVVAMIPTGRPVAVMNYTGSEADERKRIVAALMAGDAVLSIDNIEQPLQGEAICSVLTQETYQDRRLGVSETITVPTCCTWLATGNNLAMAGDLATRVLICKIDPKVERPEEREFDRDLRAHVLKNREKLVVAALTVLRAYVVAGRPNQRLTPFGRFEEWSDLVRSALVWLDRADPCVSRRDVVHDDPKREALEAVLNAMHDAFGTSPKTTPEIVRQATESGHLPLKDALELALAKGELKSKTLAYWLKRQKDRVIGGLRLRSVGSGERGASWRIESIAPKHVEAGHD